MKIGILTYHRARNFGAFIQAYALQQQLHSRFPQAEFEIIDYEERRTVTAKKVDYCKLFLKFRWKNLQKLLRLDNAFKKEYKNLPLSKHMVLNNTEKAIQLIGKKYDYIIIGSDAVFNWTLNPIPNIYFFNSNTCTHVTYAASAHLNRYKESTDEQSKYVRESLEKMQYIGVRDEETERFVKYFNPQCTTYHNCDPTVVLHLNYPTPELAEKLAKKGISRDDKIIILMLKKKEYGKYIKQTYGKDYKIVALRKENPYADVFLEDLTPFEWSKVFRYAKLTVTDFFHGSLLSLKNGTPVISIDSSNYDGYESKAKDLFIRRLNLPEMFYDAAIIDDDRAIFIEKCNHLLQTDYSDTISEALSMEAKSFDEFCTMFNELLESRG